MMEKQMQGGSESKDAETVSAWRKIVAQLNGNASTGSSKSLRAGQASRHAHIEVLERLSDGDILIAWHDATCCRYGHQRWISATAHISGRCALSGARISEDDVIYRPEERRPRLINAREMILARAIRHDEPQLENQP
ncbi:MAG: DUF3331 domain-containing protein [Burkholderia sp.]